MNDENNHENPNINANKSERQLKVSSELKKIAQDFFQKNTSGQSLITVTNADISKDLKNANIFITVMPIEKEKAVYDFAKRMRTELRSDIKRRLPIKVIPFVEIEIDEGEKIRQKIDAILSEDKRKQKKIQIDKSDNVDL